MNQRTRIVLNALDEFTEDLITRLTLQVTRELVADTPRDTGWARSNWIPAIDNPVTSPSGSKESRDAVVIDPTAQQEGLARVTTGYRLPSLVFVSNNVPYISKLNDGTSRQAPSGFVQTAISRAINEVI